MAPQFPPSFSNRLEMLKHIEADEVEKRHLIVKEKEKDAEIEQQAKILSKLTKKHHNEVDQLKIVHSSEIAQLQLQVRHMNTQVKLLRTESEAVIAELKAKSALDQAQLQHIDKTILQEREKFEKQLDNERTVSRRLTIENHTLQSTIDALQHTNSNLEFTLSRKDATLQRNHLEIETKNKALEEKDAAISDMSEQQIKTKEYLATKQQVSLISL